MSGGRSTVCMFHEGRGESPGRIAYKVQKGSDHETSSCGQKYVAVSSRTRTTSLPGVRRVFY